MPAWWHKPPKTISTWDGFWPAKEGEFYIKEFLIIDDWYDGRPGYWTLEIGRATGRFASSVLRIKSGNGSSIH